MGDAMSTLLMLTTLSLCMLTTAGIIACHRPRACFVQPVTPPPTPPRHSGGGSGGALTWLLSVNWNGDEGDKKSGGK